VREGLFKLVCLLRLSRVPPFLLPGALLSSNWSAARCVCFGNVTVLKSHSRPQSTYYPDLHVKVANGVVNTD